MSASDRLPGWTGAGLHGQLTVFAELARIEQGYWRHSPAGIPVPGFFAEHGLCLDTLPRAVRARFQASSVCLNYGTLALELEHRRQPILDASGFVATAKRIVAQDYDMALARVLAWELVAAWQAFGAGRRSTDSCKGNTGGDGRGSDRGLRRRDDLLMETYRYPAGFQANMAVIRSILATQ